jgi:hypothetical protein
MRLTPFLLLILAFGTIPSIGAGTARAQPPEKAETRPIAAPDPDSEIRQFLSQQRRIRVLAFFYNNFGHQISTLHLMERVREMGFAGTFEVVAEEGNREKLSTLMSGGLGERIGKVDYVYYRRFLENHADGRPVLKPVRLAITGGADTQLDYTFAFVKAEYYLQLQPMNWKFPRLFVANRAYTSLERFNGLPIQAHAVTSADPLTFFDQELAAVPELQYKAPGLKAIFGTPGQFEILPIYGLQMSGNPNDPITALIQGLRAATLEKPGFWDKPIVLPILTDQRNDWDSALDMAFVRQKVPYIKIGDPTLPQKLSELKAGELMFVQVSQVPADIFSYIFARGTLPGMLEGKNTAALALRLGQSYFHVKGSTFEWSHASLPDSPDRDAALAWIRESQSIFQSARWLGQIPADQAKIFVSFLREYRNPDSALRRYLGEVSTHVRAPEQDLVTQGFRALWKEIGPQEVCNANYHPKKPVK